MLNWPVCGLLGLLVVAVVTLPHYLSATFLCLMTLQTGFAHPGYL